MVAGDAQPECCDVCGRTILRGERTREYASPGGERRAVCDLCRARVENAGWVRADRLSEQPAPSRREVRGSASRWLTGRAQRARKLLERLRAPTSAEPPPPQRSGGDQAPPRPSGPETPGRRLLRALEEFNASEHRRTVAGLTRSLGEPKVSAIAPPEAPDDVRLTVAWDLSWYQWEVCLADEPARVRALAKGSELDELGDPDRAWNARATEDGKLRLASERNGSA